MNSTVYNEDCMIGMSRYPDNYFDLAVVDPEYGINVGAHRINSSRPTQKWANPLKYEYRVFDDSKPPDSEYFKELFRISRNQIIWGGNYFTKDLPPSSGWIVWDKMVDPKEHLSMCELAYSSFGRRCMRFSYLWAGFKKAHPIKRIHPTQKPVKLYDWIYKNYLPEGGKVIDTHLGSGSNRIAAHKAGNIDFTGFELDTEYYEAAEKRFSEFTSQLTLFKP